MRSKGVGGSGIPPAGGGPEGPAPAGEEAWRAEAPADPRLDPSALRSDPRRDVGAAPRQYQLEHRIDELPRHAGGPGQPASSSAHDAHTFQMAGGRSSGSMPASIRLSSSGAIQIRYSLGSSGYDQVDLQDSVQQDQVPFLCAELAKLLGTGPAPVVDLLARAASSGHDAQTLVEQLARAGVRWQHELL